MRSLRVLCLRLADLILRRSREERLSAEVNAHLDLLTDEYVARGLSPADARLAARKSFGGVDQMKSHYREQRGFRVVDEVIQDVRHASRLIARDRWLAAATVLALALGIGVSATMLSILYGMNFRELPFDNASRLVAVGGESTRTQGGQIPFAVFDAWRSTSRTFEVMAAQVPSAVNLGDEFHATDQFSGMSVSHNAFAVLGERPILGRDFRPEDDRVGAPGVIIIDHRLWTDRYGADPAVIGRLVRVNGQPATIIGVMPVGFAYPIDTQVWQPLAALPVMSTPAAAQSLVRVVGRLAEHVSVDLARAELATTASTLEIVPEADRTRRTVVMPLNEAHVGTAMQPAPMMMLAATLIVLLIAGSHAASLLLARSSARSREMSMRAALGASRGRIVRQLLVESVLLASLAGVLALVLASVGMRLFARETAGFGMPYWTKFTLDGPLFAYIALLCLATGIGFGLLPALHLSKTNLSDVLNQGRSGRTGRRAGTLTSTLLVGELALTMTLLASATVLMQSANVVYQADRSMDLDNLWEFRLMLPQPQYASSDRRTAFYRRLDERLAAAPAMESAAIAGGTPFMSGETRAVLLDNDPLSGADEARTARMVAIGDRYFDTLGLRILRGTRFEDLDAGSARAAALVNERFVERFFAGIDPIGRQVLLVNQRAPEASPERFTIVGIAPLIRHAVAAGHTPVIYVAHATQPAASASIIIRGRPERFAEMLRQEVRRIDPDLPLFRLQMLERASYVSRWIQRILSTVFSVLAIIATVLSAFGLYAITAYAATQRTYEVGVRMALGARRLQVSWLFLRRALLQVSIGLTLGIAGALAAGTVLQAALVEVRANNPVTLAGVGALLVAVSIAASVLPARKASRLDPVSALRQE